jgi:Sulfotransferase domain
MIEKPICISYPKSGRTWLRMILNSLDIDMEYSHLDTGADRKSWGKRFDELDIPCIVREKIVFLHRDPRDVVVSMFYEFTKRQLPILDQVQREKYEARGLIPPLTLSEFVRSPRFGIEKTIIFNIRCKEKLNAHLLSYEDLSTNPTEQINKLIQYLEIDRPFDQINKAVVENNFSSMRKREATGDIPANMTGRLGPTDPSDINSYKVRKGVVGGWATEMDVEIQNYVNEIIKKYSYSLNIYN